MIAQNETASASSRRHTGSHTSSLRKVRSPVALNVPTNDCNILLKYHDLDKQVKLLQSVDLDVIVDPHVYLVERLLKGLFNLMIVDAPVGSDRHLDTFLSKEDLRDATRF